jgi:hypothetical protein
MVKQLSREHGCHYHDELISKMVGREMKPMQKSFDGITTKGIAKG